MMTLEINQLSFGYGDKLLIKDISMQLPQGQVAAILGSNGAGKSTLLKIILRLLTPTYGKLLLNGKALTKPSQEIAYLPEQATFYPHLSGIENLEYLLSLSIKPRTKSDITVYLEQVGLQKSAWHTHTSEYSKGMRQKLMIALALAREAKLLLLDEPNSGLDPVATADLNRLILSLKAQQVSMLIVSHDLISIHQVADKLYMLNNGHLAELTTAECDKSNLDFNEIYRLQTHV